MASFSKKGEFIYGLIYGKETDLSPSIQQGIRKKYSSSAVFKVIEIKMPGSINYEVILQNATQYIDLGISQDGQMQEVKRITRADS